MLILKKLGGGGLTTPQYPPRYSPVCITAATYSIYMHGLTNKYTSYRAAAQSTTLCSSPLHRCVCSNTHRNCVCLHRCVCPLHTQQCSGLEHRLLSPCLTRTLRQLSRPPKVRASRGVWGHASPPGNFGFFEAQISYFQHFEEFSNKKLTLH